MLRGCLEWGNTCICVLVGGLGAGLFPSGRWGMFGPMRHAGRSCSLHNRSCQCMSPGIEVYGDHIYCTFHRCLHSLGSC